MSNRKNPGLDDSSIVEDAPTDITSVASTRSVRLLFLLPQPTNQVSRAAATQPQHSFERSDLVWCWYWQGEPHSVRGRHARCLRLGVGHQAVPGDAASIPASAVVLGIAGGTVPRTGAAYARCLRLGRGAATVGRHAGIGLGAATAGRASPSVWAAAHAPGVRAFGCNPDQKKTRQLGRA